VVVARGAGRGVAVVEFIEVGWKFISRWVYLFYVLPFHWDICPPKASPYHPSFPGYVHVVGREIIQRQLHPYLNTAFSILPFPHISVCSFILLHYSHDFPLISCYASTSFVCSCYWLMLNDFSLSSTK
jgi:hypothetical protein